MHKSTDHTQAFHQSIVDDENTQHLLRIFIGLALGTSLAYLAALLWSAGDLLLRGPGIVAAFLCGLAALIVLRRGNAAAAARILVWGVWGAVLVQVSITNGLMSRSLMALPILIVLGGWLLPARGTIALTVASLLAGLAMALAERAGVLPLVVSPSPPLLVWLAYAIYVVLAAVVAYHILRGFRLRHEALAAREAELRLLMENVPVMIFHGDREKRCLFANRSYAEFYALADNPPLGRTVRQIVGESAYHGVDERLDRVLSGERLAYRGVRRSPRGEERVLDFQLLPERDEPGAVRGFFAVINDVTAQVHAEEELRRSEHKFASVFRASPLAVAITRLDDGRYLDVNDAFVRTYGWSREETIGRTSLELGKWLAPEARNAWAAALRRAGRINSMEADFRLRNGEVHRVLLSAELIDLAGEPCALVATTDITERLQVENALRESEARLREAQRIGRIGSWDLDLVDKQLSWSSEIFRIYEREPGDFGGTFEHLLQLVHPDDLPAIRAAYRDSARGAGACEVEHRILTPAGRIKHVRAHWEVFLDADGKALRAIGTAQDITEQMLAKTEIQRLNNELESRVRERTAELQAANKELESFAYSISHDLRAPLRGIDGFSHLLAEEYGDRLDAQGHGYLERVRRAAQRMGTLIDDILELSRVSRLGMRRASVDLSELAREILDERSRATPKQAAHLVIAADCVAFGDPQLLRVLLQNLLENAWKYSSREAAPRIEFGCAMEDGERVFHVRDNGVGFDMAYASRLFAPFQRLHSPEEFEGAGIGLATVARVVNRHGGRVWAESAVGQGAVFRFTLGACAKP